MIYVVIKIIEKMIGYYIIIVSKRTYQSIVLDEVSTIFVTLQGGAALSNGVVDPGMNGYVLIQY